MKKKLIIIAVVLVVILGLVVLYKVTRNDSLISKTKIINDIKFSNAKIDEKNGKYIFAVTVTTSSKNTLKVEDFDAIIYDKKGNKLDTLTGYIGDISNNSKKEVTVESDEDLSKAYEINYTLRINND
ncbi:MAG: hypothetical protein IKE73_01215 [Bacilli bacterium]|nr:hypothetical protein [Bacilli bacterium]